MIKYLKLMRVHHYIKNFLIFLPLIFSGRLFNRELLMDAFFGYIAFCLLASAIYIINDLKDIKLDRVHPTKSQRPLAKGIIPVKSAILLSIILVFSSFLIHNFASISNNSSWFCLVMYLCLNLAYSFGLKNLPIIDVAIIVSGFVIRVLYGAEITEIELSNWLYLTTISMSFYLALGKRRNELLRQNETSRKVLQFYNHNFLDKNMYMSLALTITFYSLWTVDPITISKLSNNYLIWTVPLVILICMKYSLNIEKDSDGDPVEVILRDKTLSILIFLFLVVTLLIVYN